MTFGLNDTVANVQGSLSHYPGSPVVMLDNLDNFNFVGLFNKSPSRLFVCLFVCS